MTSTAQLLIRDKFETCLGVIRQASLQILPLLRIRVAEGKDPQWFFQQLEMARQGMGSWAAVARRLNLNDAEISQFTLSLRHLQQLVPQYERGQEVSDNQLIAALRFISFLELVRSKQPLLNYSTDVNDADERVNNTARRQIRAIELMLRGIINSAWVNQTQMVSQLTAQFGTDKVRGWLKNAERGDILSGMRFSELAQLLVDKKEFACHYATLYQSTSQLSLFIDQRKTLQTFLDDVRVLRNALMENRSLSSAQAALLDNYYDEISDAIQKACDEGRKKVNPRVLLSCDEAELEDYMDRAYRLYEATGRDTGEIKDSIERVDKADSGKKRDVADTASVALWAMVGVGVIGMVIFVLTIVNDMNKQQDPPAPEVATTVQAAEQAPEKVSPRDKLANMGITWDEFNLRSAIERGDSPVIRLFMQGGMSWKASFAEPALAADNDDALTTLLQYRSQMDEVRPCRRMINTMTQAMKDGQSLTAKRQEFLKAFCSKPGTVRRQKEDLERAVQRQAVAKKQYAEAKAQGRQPEPVKSDEVDIQRAVYKAIR